MGGAQPLAVTLNDGVALMRRGRSRRIERRIKTSYSTYTASVDEALAWAEEARRRARPSRSVCSATVPRSCPSWSRAASARMSPTRRAPTILLAGYVPAGLRSRKRPAARARSRGYLRRCTLRWPCHVQAMLGPGGRVACLRLRQQPPHRRGGGRRRRAFDYPGFVPAFVRPLFCEGKGPFRWVALSGDPEDISETDRAVAELFPTTSVCIDGSQMAEDRVAFQGLPARICWLGLRRTCQAGPAIQRMVASGELVGADRHRPRPPRQRLGRLARIARPKACTMAPTPSPTGRS